MLRPHPVPPPMSGAAPTSTGPGPSACPKTGRVAGCPLQRQPAPPGAASSRSMPCHLRSDSSCHCPFLSEVHLNLLSFSVSQPAVVQNQFSDLEVHRFCATGLIPGQPPTTL